MIETQLQLKHFKVVRDVGCIQHPFRPVGDKFMKKHFFIYLICMLLMCSCAKEKKVHDITRISYKNDLNSGRGIFAAQYLGRIYYFSEEAGISGVYTMKTDGSDVKLLFECRDVTGIQIINDMIYVLVLQDEQFEKRKVFNVEMYSITGKSMGELLDKAIYQYSGPDGFAGVSGFYVDKERNSFINTITYEDKRGIISNQMFYQKDGKINSIHEVSLDFTSGGKETAEGDMIGIYQIDNNYFSLSNYKQDIDLFHPDSVVQKAARDAYGYNSEENVCWWNYDELSNKWSGVQRIWGLLEDKMIVSEEHKVFIYNIDRHEIEKEVEFPSNGKVAYIDINKDYINVIIEENSPSVYSNRENICRQTLYCLDSNSNEPELIKYYEIGEKIIYLNDGMIMDYNGQVLNLSEIVGNEINILQTEKLEIDNTIPYQVDMAGNWVFVKYNDKKNGASDAVVKIQIPLIEKIVALKH